MTAISPLSPSSVLNPHSSRKEEIRDPFEADFCMTPPSLLHPSELPSSEYQLLRELNRFCDIHNGVIASQKDRLSTLDKEIQEACEQYTKALRENAQSLNTTNTWNFLSKVANSFLAASSFIFGLSLSANPATAFAGSALISSGLLSITNITLTHCRGWDWVTEQMVEKDQVLQAKMRAVLPLMCGVLAAGCGIAGGASAIAANAVDFSGKAAQLAQTSFTLFQGSTLAGKGISDSKLQFSQASLTQAETHRQMTQSDLDLFTNQFQGILAHFDHTMKHSRRAVQSIVQTQRSYG